MKKFRARIPHRFAVQYVENVLGRKLPGKKEHIGEVRVVNPHSNNPIFSVPFSSVIEIEALVAAGIIAGDRRNMVQSELRGSIIERTIPLKALAPEIRKRVRVLELVESSHVPASIVDHNEKGYHFVIPATANREGLVRVFSELEEANLDSSGIEFKDIDGKTSRCTVPERPVNAPCLAKTALAFDRA
jgi:hypothetical protein